jgi:F-type H+-transporting ATPase subunit b
MGLVIPDSGLLIWMLLSFGLVLFVLTKYGWNPIMRGIKSREKTIEDALLAAERTKSDMAKMQATNEKILAEAHSERDKLIKEARQLKDNIVDEAKAQAQIEAQKIVEAARISINNEKKAALKEIKDQVAELSILVAEKILKEKLSGESNQNDYIDKLLKDIKPN